MRPPSTTLAILVLALCTGNSNPEDSPGATEFESKDSGVVEHTGRRLVQLDVTVNGPQDVADRLTAQDFEIVVGGRVIEEFDLDRVYVGETPTATTDDEIAGRSLEGDDGAGPTQLSLLF